MFQTHLKSAIRSLIRFKEYSFLNLIGLVLGLTGAIVLISYVTFELSFDRFHNNKENIYRINEIYKSPNKKLNSPSTTPLAGPSLLMEYPEIKEFTRIRKRSQEHIKWNESTINSEILYIDRNFFSFFSFPLVNGNNNPFTNKKSVVLTDNIRKKLFGDHPAIGQTIDIAGRPFTVCAIAKNPPINSHIQFDVLLPMENLIDDPEYVVSWNGGIHVQTFIELNPGTVASEFEAKFTDFLWQKTNKQSNGGGFYTEYYLESLMDIHLRSNTDYDHFSRTELKQILWMLGIALLLLFVACFNYINISRGILILRQKEFNIRKNLGAGKNDILNQTLFETRFFFALASLIAFALIHISDASIVQLFGTKVNFFNYQIYHHLGLWIILITSIVFISSFIIVTGNSVRLSKKTSGSAHKYSNSSPKLSFVATIQYFASICLIISAMIVYKQLNFALNKDLGFSKDNILLIVDPVIPEYKNALTEELKKIPAVKSISASFGVPGLESTRNGYRPEGYNEWQLFHAIYVDDKFFETFDIELIEGRNYSSTKSTNHAEYIINETLAKELQWKQPIGKHIFRDGLHQVVGVVRDFHLASIYETVPPLIISRELENDFYALSVKLSSHDIRHSISEIENIWNTIIPNNPFSFSFLDESYERLYSKIKRFGFILLLFAVIAITVSMLGLFGIILLKTNSCTKEVGIRKVNGATIGDILILLNGNFVKWIAIAFVFACPFTWYAMDRWLDGFAYKINMSWWFFALSGIIALSIALLTVSWQSWRAARRNPVEALRYE